MTKKILSRDNIINAAYDYADNHGIDSLSMRKLAALLGVKAMSLYNHLRNKDDIIDCLVDKVISEIALPDVNQNWKKAMKNRAVSAHTVLLKHEWATLPIISRINVGQAMLTYFDRSLTCLRNAGFSLIEADYAINTFDSYIYGFTMIKLNFPIAEPDYAEAARDADKIIPRSSCPSLLELSQLVKERTYNGIQDFSFGLDFILEGLDRLLNKMK